MEPKKKTYLTETTIAFVVSLLGMYMYTWWSAPTVEDQVKVLAAMGSVGSVIFLGGAARKVGEKVADNIGGSVDDDPYQQRIEPKINQAHQGLPE